MSAISRFFSFILNPCTKTQVTTYEVEKDFLPEQCLEQILLCGDLFKNKIKAENQSLNLSIASCKIILQSYDTFLKQLNPEFKIEPNANHSIFERTHQVYLKIRQMQNPDRKNEFFEILENTQKEEQAKPISPTLKRSSFGIKAINTALVFKDVEGRASLHDCLQALKQKIDPLNYYDESDEI